MTKTRIRAFLIVVACACTLAAATMPAVHAQSKAAKNPGSYHGEQDFPISWKRYYSYEEWTRLMREMQAKYPQLADIESIGKSRMGREQLLLTLTSKATGKAESKPAMWVDGAIHGNEVNGITCSLYTAWYLLTRYDYDPFVHRLLDASTFYILPGLNVDANDSYVRFPNTENNPREPYRPTDDDGDGLYDEDQTEDVDGDGELSMMYVEDPAGDYKLTPDRRRFLKVEDAREAVQRFRLIGGEGYDNDGDGLINEDDIGGPDPNRNFPFGWTLASGYPYPLSEAETRNVFDFQLAHPNIVAALNYHNIGRLIMFQLPAATRASASLSPEARQRAADAHKQRLAELRKTNKYAFVAERQVAPEYTRDLTAQNELVSTGARLLKDYSPTPAGTMGMAAATTYGMFGAYSYLIELWGDQPGEADLDGDGDVSPEEYLKWIDLELKGEGWVAPHLVKHQDLGDIWIGGTPKKHIGRTPPSRYIEGEAMRNNDFVLYLASQFPRVEVESVTVSPIGADLFWVTAAVTNDRAMPTASDRALAVGRVPKDRITVTASAGATILDVPDGPTAVAPVNPRFTTGVVKGVKGTEFTLGGHETKRFSALVKLKGDGWVEFSVTSRNGGSATRRVTLKMQ